MRFEGGEYAVLIYISVCVARIPMLIKECRFEDVNMYIHIYVVILHLI